MSHLCAGIRGAALLTIGLFAATGVASPVSPPSDHKSSILQVKVGVTQPAAYSEVFPCTNPKMQAPGNPPSKHSVTLSWKAPASSGPGVDNAGYNLYRLNRDGSCTKVNGQP